MAKDKEEEEENTTRTTLRIPSAILRELKQISIDSDKTLTEIITEALSEYVKEEREVRNYYTIIR